MPWTAADAPQHTKQATTEALRRLWAKVANEALERGESDASAIRQANAVVARYRGHRWV